MTQKCSVFAAGLMLTFSIGAFQPSQAAALNFGQASETGAYAVAPSDVAGH